MQAVITNLRAALDRLDALGAGASPLAISIDAALAIAERASPAAPDRWAETANRLAPGEAVPYPPAAAGGQPWPLAFHDRLRVGNTGPRTAVRSAE